MKRLLILLLCMLVCLPAFACAALEKTPELTHFLVLGFDFWGDERIGVSYSDTNILATIDSANERLMITSLLRDSYVEKPDGSWGRLNNIVRDEGFDAMLETIEINYGVPVDTYIAIGVQGMRRMIDAVGGVEITLTRAEAEQLAGPWEISGINGAGTYQLDSKAAMAYIRLRKIAGHDIGRSERQRNVLEQVFARLQDMSIGEAVSLAQLLFEEVETNISLQALLKAVSSVYALRDQPLETMRLPIDGGYENVTEHGMAVYSIDWPANRAALDAFLMQGVVPVQAEETP